MPAAQGMSEDQVLDTLLLKSRTPNRAAEDTLRASLLDRELNQEKCGKKSRKRLKGTRRTGGGRRLRDGTFLAKYREQRISELRINKKQKCTVKFGNTTGPVDAGDQGIESIWVFVHLYEDPSGTVWY